MDNEQALQVIEAFLEDVMDQGFAPDVLEHAIWMELEARLGPLVYDAFEVEVQVDDEGAELRIEMTDGYLAERLLKRYLPVGSA